MRTEELASALDAAADVLIPGIDGWPAPSQLRLAADLLGRLREGEAATVRRAVESLESAGLLAAGAAEARTAVMMEFSQSEPALFEVLRRCVYYAYYAQPRVVTALRERGYDINESPQPRGYHMDPLTPRDIAGVDTTRSVWIPVERVGIPLRRAS